MDVVADLERAREYHRRQQWADACDAFRTIDGISPLEIGDLERLAESTHILGRGDEAASLLQRAYQVHVAAGDIGRAVRDAFYLWHALAAKGEFAHAGGWIARAWRLTETQPECAELGYLLIPEAERQFGESDFAGAFATAGRAVGRDGKPMREPGSGHNRRAHSGPCQDQGGAGQGGSGAARRGHGGGHGWRNVVRGHLLDLLQRHRRLP